MLAAHGRAAWSYRQRSGSQARPKPRSQCVVHIAAPTTVTDAQAVWTPVVPEQHQQPALLSRAVILPRTEVPEERQGPVQQQWNWKWGSSISYTQAGCPSDGRPALLLLHGFGVSHKHFVHNIEPLAEQYTVYAVDLLGHGGSWPSQHFCEHSGQQLHYNVATYTEQLHSFIQERIGQPVYVAGNSLGGFLAANLAAHHPQAVRGVVLLNAAPFTSPYIPGRDLLMWRLLAAAADDALPAPREHIASFVRDFWWDIIRQPDSIRLVLQLVYARHSAIDDQLVQCILEPTAHPQALDAFISMVLSPAGKLSFEQVLQRVDCPVCLAYGREDPWVAPLYGHRAKRLLPSAVYLELSPAGHCPHHEAPTAVNSIIAAFIDAVEVGQHHQHELMQAGAVTSFEEGEGCTVQVACVDGSPRNMLEAADAAVWQLKQRAAQLLRRLVFRFALAVLYLTCSSRQ